MKRAMIDISKLQKSKNYTVDWMPRKNIFKRGSLILNPQTMIATSYDWYNIAQVIKGKLVLNTYSYSVSTTKHVYQLRSLFSQLNLDYVTLEAPRGLQNLDRAKEEEIFQWAKSEVENKYSRQPRKPSFKITRLDALKIKYSKIELSNALTEAENNRRVRLDEQKRKRLLNSVEIEVVEREDLSSIEDALIVHPYPHRYISDYQKNEFKKQALEAGFKKVIVNVVME